MFTKSEDVSGEVFSPDELEMPKDPLDTTYQMASPVIIDFGTDDAVWVFPFFPPPPFFFFVAFPVCILASFLLNYSRKVARERSFAFILVFYACHKYPIQSIFLIEIPAISYYILFKTLYWIVFD